MEMKNPASLRDFLREEVFVGYDSDVIFDRTGIDRDVMIGHRPITDEMISAIEEHFGVSAAILSNLRRD